MGNNLTKYIVYITTNLVNKKIYVGVHKTQFPYKFDGYLGCGIYENDRHSYTFNKYPLGKAITKYGPKKFMRVTLGVYDTNEEALAFEKSIVTKEFINRSDTYNATIGEGQPPIVSKAIYQYDLSGKFIKEWPSITEASIYYKCASSSIGKAIFDKTPSKGFLWTEFKVQNIDINKFKIGENKIKVYVYTITGKFIKSYNSIAECAKELKRGRSAVSNALHGKYALSKQYYISYNKYDIYPIITETRRIRPIYQYSLSGEFIKEWSNIRAAATDLNINETCIAISMKKETSAGGFQWRYDKFECIKSFKNKTKAKKVGKYTLEGELIQIYNTVGAARKACSSSINVLYGRQKSAGGFIWKFVD